MDTVSIVQCKYTLQYVDSCKIKSSTHIRLTGNQFSLDYQSQNSAEIWIECLRSCSGKLFRNLTRKNRVVMSHLAQWR